jgi:hypothetical protein
LEASTGTFNFTSLMVLYAIALLAMFLYKGLGQQQESAP